MSNSLPEVPFLDPFPAATASEPTPLAEALNEVLRLHAPALHAALGPMGRRAYYPQEIPFQAQQARGARYNGTIGQITDGTGRVLAPEAMDTALAGLSPEDANTALLYSPIEGLLHVREGWRRWQRAQVDPAVPSTLPLVTAGLSHGLAVAADLFAAPGRKVAAAAPFWGNYRLMIEMRHGANVITGAAYRDDAFNPDAIREAAIAANLTEDEPLVAILNLPSNPGGYAPTGAERDALADSLIDLARERPVVVLCDDAYNGLVFDAVPDQSIFWDLIGRHENLVPIKVDGATKEFSFFGGRVGFLTFPFNHDSPEAVAINDKAKGLIRSSIGSPTATGQVLVHQALQAEGIEAQVAEVRRELATRYRVLKTALDQVDPTLLRPLPFNAGCFALAEIVPEGLSSEMVRRHLLEAFDTGVVAIPPNYLRIAFCSTEAEAIPELVRRCAAGVESLARESNRIVA